jgi:hypothetical protein
LVRPAGRTAIRLIPVKDAVGASGYPSGRQRGSSKMPTETIVVVAAVMAAFVFFAVVLAYSDMTWSKTPRRRSGDGR